MFWVPPPVLAIEWNDREGSEGSSEGRQPVNEVSGEINDSIASFQGELDWVKDTADALLNLKMLDSNSNLLQYFCCIFGDSFHKLTVQQIAQKIQQFPAGFSTLFHFADQNAPFDVKLVSEDGFVLVHKFFMVAHFDYFEALFSGVWTNLVSEEGMVVHKLPGITNDVLRNIVQYCYGGTLSHLQNATEDIVFSSTKACNRLLSKSLCSLIIKRFILTSPLNSQNACQKLLLAKQIETVESEKLQCLCIAAIVRLKTDMSSLQGYANLHPSDQNFLQVLQQFYAHRDKTKIGFDGSVHDLREVLGILQESILDNSIAYELSAAQFESDYACCQNEILNFEESKRLSWIWGDQQKLDASYARLQRLEKIKESLFQQKKNIENQKAFYSKQQRICNLLFSENETAECS